MTTGFDQFSWARAAFAAFRHKLNFKFSLGLALLALSAGTGAAQAPPERSIPIRRGTQPFAVTMGADGNFWFTLSNSNEVARITPAARSVT